MILKKKNPIIIVIKKTYHRSRILGKLCVFGTEMIHSDYNMLCDYRYIHIYLHTYIDNTIPSLLDIVVNSSHEGFK